MEPTIGLREQKKARTRQHIADVAASLFAEHGYDAVTMLEVARAAGVSDQTVYNYFPAKQDLVLDRAEQIRGLYRDAVTGRPAGVTPAAALEPIVREDVERYRSADLAEAAGEFPAQSVASPVLRRFALEERGRQADVLTEAIVATVPAMPAIVAHAHAAAIVAVVQAVQDRIGAHVLEGAAQDASADALQAVVDVAFASLDRTFAHLVADETTPRRSS